MTLKDVKNVLTDAQWARRRLEALTEHLAYLRQLGGSKVSSFGSIGTGGAKHDIGDDVAVIVDYEAEVRTAKAQLIDHLRKVKGLISLAANQDHRLVLELRYRDGYQWAQVAAKMHMSLRLVYYTHRKALIAVRDAANVNSFVLS